MPAPNQIGAVCVTTTEISIYKTAYDHRFLKIYQWEVITIGFCMPRWLNYKLMHIVRVHGSENIMNCFMECSHPRPPSPAPSLPLSNHLSPIPQSRPFQTKSGRRGWQSHAVAFPAAARAFSSRPGDSKEGAAVARHKGTARAAPKRSDVGVVHCYWTDVNSSLTKDKTKSDLYIWGRGHSLDKTIPLTCNEVFHSTGSTSTDMLLPCGQLQGSAAWFCPTTTRPHHAF